LAAGAPAMVMELNRVLLPTLGKPTIPSFINVLPRLLCVLPPASLSFVKLNLRRYVKLGVISFVYYSDLTALIQENDYTSFLNHIFFFRGYANPFPFFAVIYCKTIEKAPQL
jgi:hypothetical protein